MKAPMAMSWPWGEYDDVAIEAALLAGYEAALSMDCGPNRPGTPLFALRRVRMHRRARRPSIQFPGGCSPARDRPARFSSP